MTKMSQQKNDWNVSAKENEVLKCYKQYFLDVKLYLITTKYKVEITNLKKMLVPVFV